MSSLFKDIDGDSVELVELDVKYLLDMWEYSSNPEMYKHFEFSPQKNISDTKEYLEKLIKRSNGVNAHWWFIKVKESGKVVGSFGIHDIDFHRHSCEISYAVSPDFWGKGIFGESLKLVLDFLINKSDFYRITATTSSNNIRSINALKKAGFREEGTLRDFYLKDENVRYDATILALLSVDYSN